MDDESLGEWRPVAADRCDGLECGAQAWVCVTVNGTNLMYCANHYRRFEAKLIEVATRIRDFRFMLDMP
jgi:hypothetical protein